MRVKVSIESVLGRIVEYSVYGLVFIIPFSKAGIEIFATIAITSWLILRLFRRFATRNDARETRPCFFPQTPLSKQIFLLFIISFISVLFSADLALSAKALFAKLGEYLLLFFVIADVFSQKRSGKSRLKIFLYIALVSVVILFIDAIFQWYTGKDFIRGFGLGQLRACFSNANDFAGYLIAITPVLFAAIFFKHKDKKNIRFLAEKLTYVILFLTALILLSKAFSRGAYLGCILSFLFILTMLFNNMYKNKRKLIIVLGGICVCLFIVLGILFAKPAMNRLVSILTGFDASRERIWYWKEAFLIVCDFPVFGTGPNTYTAVISKYSISKITGCYPHNCYLHIAAETGILGLLAFLLVLWRFFKEGLCVIGRSIGHGNERLLLLGIISGIVATLVQSFFDTNLFALRLVTLFWIMLGIGTALIMRMTNNGLNEKGDDINE